MKIAVVALLAIALTSCVSHDYLGDRYPPTAAVVVFYPHEDVPEGYVVIGTGRSEGSSSLSAEEIVEKVRAKAREVGAHAVAIQELGIEYVGETSTTAGEQHWGNWHSHTTTSVSRQKVLRVTYLRLAAETPSADGPAREGAGATPPPAP